MTLAVSANLAATTQLLGLGEATATLYVGDTHMKDVGRQTFLTNSFVGGLVHSAYHPLLATLTRGLYLDELLAREKEASGRVSIQGMGDYTDTPADIEAALATSVFVRSGIRMDGCDMENHGSSNAWGVVNLLSGSYNWIKRNVFRRLGLLDEELIRAVGGAAEVLTPKDTITMAHGLLHHTRPDDSTPESLSTEVRENDEAYRSASYEHFWKCSAADLSYWECLVNYDVADRKQTERGGRTPAIYLQAHEHARIPIDDREVPVFDISLDTQDHNHLLAVMPGISEFQIRLVESFMDHQLRLNPHARFRLSAHFPLSRVSNFFSSCEEKKALRRLLSREEIIFVTGAHTHARDDRDLTSKMGLKRKSPLRQVTWPAIVTHSPWQDRKGGAHSAAQAIGRDRMWVEKGENGRAELKIAPEFRGLNPQDINASNEVQEALKSYARDHGFLRAEESKKAAKQFFVVFLKRQARRFGEFFTQAINPVSKKKIGQYWREDSWLRNAVDNLTAVSVVEAFNEAQHLIPFLESVIHFLEVEPTPAALAVRAQIEGVFTMLSGAYVQGRDAFEKAVGRGDDPHSLRRYDDFLARTGVNTLPGILLNLPRGSQARDFALLGGMSASRAEYERHRGKPTRVPNQVEPISVPV